MVITTYRIPFFALKILLACWLMKVFIKSSRSIFRLLNCIQVSPIMVDPPVTKTIFSPWIALFLVIVVKGWFFLVVRAIKCAFYLKSIKVGRQI